MNACRDGGLIIVLGALMLVAGCGDSGSLLAQAQKTKVMSLLKMYSVAQEMNRMETEGRYGSMAELVRAGRLTGELAAAWDGQANPVSVGGYLFHDIEVADKGPRLHAGLCAYMPKGDGDVVLMLLDGTVANDSDSWNYYEASARAVSAPLLQWPDAGELSKYRKLTKYSPEEGVNEAKRLYEKAGEGPNLKHTTP